jgi:NADH-quinone oxidoreductase subunit E
VTKGGPINAAPRFWGQTDAQGSAGFTKESVSYVSRMGLYAIRNLAAVGDFGGDRARNRLVCLGRGAADQGAPIGVAGLRAELAACQSKGREQAGRIAILETEAARAAAVADIKAESAAALMARSPAPAAVMAPEAATPCKAVVATAPAAIEAPVTKSAKPAKATVVKATVAKPAAKAAVGKPAATKSAAKSASTAPAKPKTLTAARGGKADDLKLINGVGPKLEALLHRLGFFHFDQVAGWTTKDLARVDDNLEDFRGRATRENWVGQAKALAKGGPARPASKARATKA